MSRGTDPRARKHPHAIVPRAAFEARKAKRPVWSVDEVSRLLASARTMPDDDADRFDSVIAARYFWPGLLYAILGIAARTDELLALPRTAFDARAGRLSVGLYIYGELHPLVFDALRAASKHDAPQLLPWHLDGGSETPTMLYRRMHLLLWRAGLPHTPQNMFDRLRMTALDVPGLLDQINPKLTIKPRPGKPTHPKKALVKARVSRGRKAGAGRRAHITLNRRRDAAKGLPELYILRSNRPETLKRFFEDTYRPRRLADSSARTIGDYRGCIERLSQFLGHDVAARELCDDLIERFLVAMLGTGLAPSTVNNKYRASLLALWRYAWRKRKTEELPRDVEKFREPTRLPEAWSQAEVARIIAAAGSAEGDFCGVPSRLWWPALLLTLYDTGLRIDALLGTRTDELRADGWLFVGFDRQKQKADQAFKLHPETMAAIAATMPGRRELLFPWPYADRRHALWNRFRKILQAAGLPHGRRDLFHRIRRTPRHVSRERDRLGNRPEVTRAFRPKRDAAVHRSALSHESEGHDGSASEADRAF